MFDEDVPGGRAPAPDEVHLQPHAAGRALLVRDGLARAEVLARLIEEEGYDVELVRDGVHALARARVVRVDVVLTALVHVRGSGLDLAEALVRGAPTTQVLLLAQAAPLEAQRQRLRDLANVRLIAMSAEPEDMVLAVRQAFESAVGFQGHVFGVSLVDLAQLCHLARRTVTVFVTGVEKGAIHFVRGQLVHAELGLHRGERALEALLSWNVGQLRMSPLASTERTIDRAFQALLLDTLRRIDEGRARAVIEALHEPARKGDEDEDIVVVLERVLGDGAVEKVD